MLQCPKFKMNFVRRRLPTFIKFSNFLCINRNFNIGIFTTGRKLNCNNGFQNQRICGQSSLLVNQNTCYDFHRNYAKGRDIKKTKGKKKVEINPEEMAKVMDIESYKLKLQSLVDAMKEDFIKNLSLRSTTGSIETLPIKFSGKNYTLQELAQIIRKNPKTIVLNMASFPQAIPLALKALADSGMNLNPQQDGTTVYLPVPKVTKEHREMLAKNAKAIYIKCRDNIKLIQNKNLKNVKKQTNISEDLIRNLETHLEQVTESYIAEAEKILETKRTELVGIGK